MSHVLWLDEIGESDRPRVGAKAFALARLRRAGLPVPDGFVLTGGDESLDGARREALIAAYRGLGGAVAVRSSSTAEDLADASFAGQYRTLLDVSGEEAVVEAAATCLQSAREGAGYARAVRAPEAGAMAVLVQRFVEPRSAGVVFTRHPHDERSLLVESHAGRGEELVSGRVRPDRYVLDRETGMLREGPQDASLDPASLAELAHLARRAEQLFGATQDVEWAIGSAGAVLLQARPITVEAEERPDPSLRLTRANVGEVLPDPVTPLTWTTLVAYLEHGFHEVARGAGLLPAGEAGRFLLLHHRRLYLNLSLAVEVGMRLPGISTAHAEQLILGGGAITRAPSRVAPTALFGLVRVARGLLGLALRLAREIDAAAAAVGRLPGRSKIERAGPTRLVEWLHGFAETGRGLATTHIATSGASAFHLALLGRALAFFGPGDAVARANRLVAGIGDVVSASPALALEALAERARQDPEWSAWLAQPAEAAAASLARGEAPAGLASGLRTFLERFGHRGLSEGELAASVWEDDPSPVLASLKTLVASSRPVALARRGAAETRAADEEALLSRLGPLGRTVLRAVLRPAQGWLRRREETKSLAVALVHHGRRLARAAARHLVATGVLARDGDVYFLTFDELVAALEGRPAPSAALERRRRRHEREAALPAPREVDLGREAQEKVEGAAHALAGIGVSAGVGSGLARVFESGVAPRLEPGEVLVAPVLDAAFGPLLASASAAVAEIGGMLSHGSVVARELGIPCVVDVAGATRRIRTGERVTVDGGSGRIRLEPPDGERATRGTGLPSILGAADPADEAFHALEDDPLARESVYFNMYDPEAGIALVGSLGVKRGDRGESLLALSLPDGRVLFGLDLGEPRPARAGLGVGPASISWQPTRLAFEGTLAVHEADDFPPPPVPLLLAPRTVRASIDLAFVPATPAVDLCDGLTEDLRTAVAPLGRHHVEQSGAWRGTLALDGRARRFEGTGSRDHSWGTRDWEAADHWRLFTVSFGEDLGLNALAVSARGSIVEGGFVWRDGRAERITRVLYAGQREQGRLRTVEIEIATAAGAPLSVRGTVVRTVTVPVQPERRIWRHVAGRPYRLLLHENYTRFECAGRVGLGMAEFTQRPL